MYVNMHGIVSFLENVYICLVRHNKSRKSYELDMARLALVSEREGGGTVTVYSCIISRLCGLIIERARVMNSSRFMLCNFLVAFTYLWL